MAASPDRRADAEIVLPQPCDAVLVFRVGAEEVELDATVVRATARTVVVALASGVSTLALATARRCELVMPVEGGEVRLVCRPGRRVDDIPESTRIELVLTAGPDLAAVFAS
jgi:hypothetical protein